MAAPRLGSAQGPGLARRVTWLPATRHVPGAFGGAPRQGRETLPAPPTPLAGLGRAAPPTPGRARGSAGAAALRGRPPPCPARFAEPGPAPRGTLQSAARVPAAACPPGPPSAASGKPGLRGAGPGRGRARPRAGSFIAGWSSWPPRPAGRLLRAAPGRVARALAEARAGKAAAEAAHGPGWVFGAAGGSTPLRACGEATRHPHPARAPALAGRAWGVGPEGPVGTRRRSAVAGREGRLGSQGLPAVTQTLPLHPGPTRQQGRRDRLGFAQTGPPRRGGG